MAIDLSRQLPAADEIGTLGIMANATVIFDAFDQPAFTLFLEHTAVGPATRDLIPRDRRRLGR